LSGHFVFSYLRVQQPLSMQLIDRDPICRYVHYRRVSLWRFWCWFPLNARRRINRREPLCKSHSAILISRTADCNETSSV